MVTASFISNNVKSFTMRNILLLILLVGLLSGCYDDYRLDYPYSTVAFSDATGGVDVPGVLGRTVVKGEGLSLDMGVYLAGILENSEERWVEYEIDESLLEGTSYELLPSSYYQLSDNSKFVIKPGEFTGRVTITLDSVAFLSDARATEYKLALPIRLLQTSEDSVLQTQSTKIVAIKYINHFTGPMPILIPLMLPIELISNLARILSLSIRLFGNIMAKETLLGILFTLAGMFFAPLPIMVLGVLVSLVQAMVFVLLTVIYFAQAQEHAH